MRKQFLYLFLSLVFVHKTDAKQEDTKLGFIDMEYILQNVPDYTKQGAIRAKTENGNLRLMLKIEINKLKEP
jgi:Skp family chaperone for outer membrane proteins